MAKIDYIKLSKVRQEDGKAELILRLYVSKEFRPQFRTGLFIAPERFINKSNSERCREYEIRIPKGGKLNFVEVKELQEVKAKFESYLNRIIRICDVTAEKHKDELSTEWIEAALGVTADIAPENISYEVISSLMEEKKESEWQEAHKMDFFDCIIDFRDNAKKKVNGKREGDKSDVWKKNFDVLIRALRRYEMFVQLSDKTKRNFRLDIDTINNEVIEDIESFLRNEHTLFDEYPSIFKKFPASTDGRRGPKPRPRGSNTICALFNKLKAFFNWLNEKKTTTNNPFIGYEGVVSEKYGTPYYITLEERNQIAEADLSKYPSLAVQRDIFVFQCLIGCRVSDLIKMTRNNVIDGAIEYIPHKTKGERQNVVRVPLNERAAALLKRYKNVDSKGRIFPFISAQKYNDSIKEVFRLSGVTRKVTTIDSITGEEIQKPINELASSHMARRTFVGNLYKKVKDPNLIASMSGHAEGSKAFNRYRKIDDDLKKEIVSLID
ncbi:IntN1 [gut metagenome]|uniref:IntN1 n=1 Tax=gut metagenome TaxID=749906 RepID=J9GGI8_9ZZZZ